MKPWKFTTARDFKLSATERLESIQREPNLLEFLGAQTWGALTRFYLRLFHQFEVIGKEHLPQSTPFILVANHESHLDAVCLAAALPARIAVSVHPVAASDTFFRTRSSSLFTALTVNALPLSRKKRHSAYREILALRERLLGADSGLILFPEGTRTRDGQICTFKKGIGMLVAETDVPVLPCFIEGAFEALPPDSRFPRRQHISLVIGEPISFSNVPNRDEGWQEIALTLENAVRNLSVTPK